MFRCSNPDCRALHPADPQGHCPACIKPDGSGWSCVPERERVTSDKERLDWLESLMRPKDGYVEVYLAGLRSGHAEASAYQVELQDKPAVSGATLREAIDNAMKAM